MNKATACTNAAILTALLSIRPASGLEPVAAAGVGEAPRTVTEFAKITPSAGYPVAFGASVAVSGDDLVVGAPDYISKDGLVGAAYVFHRVGPRWIEKATLVPLFGAVDGGDFGFTVAIEGDYIVVGAPQIIPGLLGGGVGSAYIFRRDDGGTPDDPLDDQWWQDAVFRTPDETRPGDRFGTSVSISEGTALIGRPGSEYTSGSAYLYRKENDVWRHVGSLNPSDSVLFDQFGDAVSLSGPVALVGAPRRSEDGMRLGGAYVFRRTASGWSQEVKLLPSLDPVFGAIGRSVAVGGEQAVVGGAGGKDIGHVLDSAYVFTHGEVLWSKETRLLGSDTSDLDSFGQAVATDGRIIVVGAPGENAHFGAAYLFTPDADGWIERRKFVASDRPTTELLGVSVAVDGDYAFAGAEDAAFIYVLPSATRTLGDFAVFQTCFHAQDRGLMSKCAELDLMVDGQIDLCDFNELLAKFAGP